MSAQEQASPPPPDHEAQESGQQDQGESQNDDDAPMVHLTPKDYRSGALQKRPKLEAEGKEVVLMSELKSLIPRQPDEPGADYAKRYSEGMNSMIRRGVMILNDQTTADVRPGKFMTRDYEFDVGPQSGVTKGEYRDLSQWVTKEGREVGAIVPERFRKFEVKKNVEIK